MLCKLIIVYMYCICIVSSKNIQCDILVAGGSTAALATAITSAKHQANLKVCLTEPHNWLGGQLTNEAVSAIDFGSCNNLDHPQYLPDDFVDLVKSIGSEVNIGNCWVSTRCYIPPMLINAWIKIALDKLPNLHVFYNTVVKNVTTSGRSIQAVAAVQRTEKQNDKDQLFSSIIEDWYSVEESETYSKEVIKFVSLRSQMIVVEATNFGDVLVLAGASYRQGIEVPEESSGITLDTCGQTITYPFFIEYHYDELDSIVDDWVPRSNDTDFSLNDQTWGAVWSYRRGIGFAYGERDDPKPGEISQMNWGTKGGNDYLNGYIFLPLDDVIDQTDDWKGGLNVTTLLEAERRAYGFYLWFKEQADDSVKSHLSLSSVYMTDTEHRLSKSPYLRDSRRSIGLDDFVIFKMDLANGTLNMFPDRIGVGHYHYADTHPLDSCIPPDYTENDDIVPYYIPFRALTNRDFDNLLVAGKTMAATYLGNAAIRLHPEEWISGFAAGWASVFMMNLNFTSREMYEQVDLLQDEIRKEMKLEWGNYSFPDSPYVCVIDDDNDVFEGVSSNIKANVVIVVLLASFGVVWI